MAKQDKHETKYASALRRHAEELVDIGSGTLQNVPPERILNVLHELRVHQIELEMQNEELRRAQGELEESRSKYVDLYDFAPIGYITLGQNGSIIEANLAAAELLEIERRYLIRRAFSSLVSPDFRGVFILHRKQVSQTLTPQACELKLLKKGVEPFYAHLRSIAVQDSTGTPVQIRMAISDITERKQAEEAQQKSERKYRQLIETLHEGIWVIDRNSSITFVNPRLAEMFGYTVEEMQGKHLFSFMDEQGIETARNMERLRRGIKEQHELAFVRKDGSRIHVIMETSPMMDERGVYAGALAGVQDITERKQTERIKDEFIGMVSHEIKTPLTVIIGSLSVAGMEGIPAEQSRELIRNAGLYAEALAGIVENLLELSRHQSDRLALQSERTEIATMTREVIGKLQTKSAVHHLTIDIPPDIPAVTVDRIRMERVLHNLVENAIKYSPKGGEVKVFARHEEAQLVIGVSDKGMGISPEDQIRLFQPFERIAAYENDTIAGLGLGLRVCRILVEAHGGRIWLESEKGKGSTFFFTVPIEGEVGKVSN
ncbi:MAG: PAS domain S-box protein [Dehalococcoidia bacterium]|nr:PAS domain S-box protein [Dehalococcoidia bacterium]